MCGIAGIYYKKGTLPHNFPHDEILLLLKHRGPNHQAAYTTKQTALYHTRLSIVDTSTASHQPYVLNANGPALVFNGEIFNYKTLGSGLADVKTTGDVEVLFKLLERDGLNCLDQLNGFFAFAFYNPANNNLLLARDRFGVKPLYYYNDDEKFAFASELKPLLKLVGRQALNPEQLYTYFRLNYSAGPQTVFKNIYRLLPGQSIHVNKNSLNITTWYKARAKSNSQSLYHLLNDAVKIRLNADVPLGTFLSGGIDSSIISALAKKHKPDLETFSIGFDKETFFDETAWSEMVAKHINSRHHVVKLKEDDFLQHIDSFLNNIDEPFADSSAFNFYMLSRYTQNHVTVALSGDGADELFKGYNKHRALLLNKNFGNRLFARTAGLLLGKAKESRDGTIQNKLRQLGKFNSLSGLSQVQKQQYLASISNHDEVSALLAVPFTHNYFESLFQTTEGFSEFEFENVFDIQTVLSDDMLVKADRFSMCHGLEIRNPFLDYRVVEYALNLNENEKINSKGQKLILKKEFSGLLPPEVFSRSKKGFELPLQKWLSRQLRNKVENEWLNADKIEATGMLRSNQVNKIKAQAFSDNPGDSAAKLWAIVVFQKWFDSLEKL